MILHLHLLLIVISAASFSLAITDLNGYTQCGQNRFELARKTSSPYALPNEFPWMVRLEIYPTNRVNPIYCSAALIDSDWLLTSARCVLGQNGTRPVGIMANLGKHNLSTRFEPGERVVPVVNLFVQDDLALLRLLSRIDLSNEIQRICLPDESMCDDPTSYKTIPTLPVDGCLDGIVAGWDYLYDTLNPSDSLLKKISLSIVDYANCGSVPNFSVSKMCAYSIDELSYHGEEEIMTGRQIPHELTQQADNGAAFMCYTKRGVTLIGINANNRSEMTSSTVWEFHRICPALKWIRETTLLIGNSAFATAIPRSAKARGKSLLSPAKHEATTIQEATIYDCSQLPKRNMDYNNCEGSMSTRYYYNDLDGSCVSFHGCEPGPSRRKINNFQYSDDCQYYCPSQREFTHVKQEIFRNCEKIPISGLDYKPCKKEKGHFLSPPKTYYYYSSNANCVPFTACGVNVDPFEANVTIFRTLAECLEMCSTQEEDEDSSKDDHSNEDYDGFSNFPTSTRCSNIPVPGVHYRLCNRHEPGLLAKPVTYYYYNTTANCTPFLACGLNVDYFDINITVFRSLAECWETCFPDLGDDVTKVEPPFLKVRKAPGIRRTTTTTTTTTQAASEDVDVTTEYYYDYYDKEKSVVVVKEVFVVHNTSTNAPTPPIVLPPSPFPLRPQQNDIIRPTTILPSAQALLLELSRCNCSILTGGSMRLQANNDRSFILTIVTVAVVDVLQSL